MDNSFQVYLRQIKEVPLLTADKEKELALAFQNGDKSAKNKLVSANLRLVIMAAKQYKAQTSLSFEDLVQEGNLGLMRAVESFDPQKGFRFTTYAMYWIKQGISRAILNNSRIIRLPVHIIELKSKYAKAQDILQKDLNRKPTIVEIANYLKVDVKKIKEIEELIKEPISLNTALNDEDEGTVEDLVSDPNVVDPDKKLDNEFLSQALHKMLDTLTSKEKDIIIARYGLNKQKPKTLEQLGIEYGVTKERIRQIEQKALNKLRNPVRTKILKPHLD